MKTSIDLGLWIRLTNTIGQDPNPKNLIGVIYMDLRISITQIPNQYPVAWFLYKISCAVFQEKIYEERLSTTYITK